MPNLAQHSRAAGSLPCHLLLTAKPRGQLEEHHGCKYGIKVLDAGVLRQESRRAFHDTPCTHRTQHSHQFAITICAILLLRARAPAPRLSGGRDQHPAHQEDTREGIMCFLNNITKSNNLISSGESWPGSEVTAVTEDRQCHRAAAMRMTEPFKSTARTFYFFSSQNAIVNPNTLG